jgi:hypothetical protein
VKAFKKAQGVRFTDKAGKSTADCYQPVAYSAFRVQAFPGLPADAALGTSKAYIRRKSKNLSIEKSTLNIVMSQRRASRAEG